MVRGLCPAGVEEHSKCEKGFYGNLGEPPTSNREVVKKKKKDLPHPKSPGKTGKYCHLSKRQEKAIPTMVSKAEGNRMRGDG